MSPIDLRRRIRLLTISLSFVNLNLSLLESDAFTLVIVDFEEHVIFTDAESSIRVVRISACHSISV